MTVDSNGNRVKEKKEKNEERSIERHDSLWFEMSMSFLLRWRSSYRSTNLFFMSTVSSQKNDEIRVWLGAKKSKGGIAYSSMEKRTMHLITFNQVVAFTRSVEMERDGKQTLNLVGLGESADLADDDLSLGLDLGPQGAEVGGVGPEERKHVMEGVVGDHAAFVEHGGHGVLRQLLDALELRGDAGGQVLGDLGNLVPHTAGDATDDAGDVAPEFQIALEKNIPIKVRMNMVMSILVNCSLFILSFRM